jgi:hypothetical protein
MDALQLWLQTTGVLTALLMTAIPTLNVSAFYLINCEQANTFYDQFEYWKVSSP